VIRLYATLQQLNHLSHDDIVTLLHWAVLCVTTLLSILIGLGTWVMRKAFKIAADKTADALQKLDKIEQATVVQATNHLEHIETESVKTNDILGRMEISQAEMSGKISTLCDIMASKS
jgi:membrane protein required for beta-lactamase induction